MDLNAKLDILQQNTGGKIFGKTGLIRALDTKSIIYKEKFDQPGLNGGVLGLRWM